MIRLILIFTAFLMAGCSSTPKMEVIPESADASAEVQQLQLEMAQAQQKQADILAPKAWSEASNYSKTAQARLANKESKSKILYSVAAGRAWLNRAKDTAALAQNSVPEIMEVRMQALDAQAPEYASKEFNKAEDTFRTQTKDKEGENFGIADDDRGMIRNLYTSAHIVALQNRYLGDARAQIHDAEVEGAPKLVPHLYDSAVRDLKNAQAYIAANRLDIAGIEQHARAANADARRLNRLTKEAASVTTTSPEQTALALDKFQRRNRALSSQLDQQAFQEKYEEARQMFEPAEAEVYKQGDELLIRMKGIQFLTNRSELPPDSYALVTKVGSVIKNFGEPRVRIEGHTDATGSQVRNMTLSQDRAEAVKSYLVANLGMNPDRIEIQGMGDTRPIVSNKTSVGRAQNRRVDVIVMPQVENGTPSIRQAQ